jgi:LmbE family N-acetylglucosaminyl deacetylase
MATLVCFHAHPDDEALSTGGTIARYSSQGHRVVLVFATGGEHGEVDPAMLAEGQTIAELRRGEVERSAEALGVARVEWLGYCDSGMIGTPENDAPESFWRADLEEAAARLAAILVEESASVLTCYDDHGNYGHPDHIQVHRVGHLAGAKAGTPKIYEATINRDHLREMIAVAAASGLDLPEGTPDDEFFDTLGMPASAITTALDIRPWIDAKRASLAAHESQVVDTAYFLSMPLDLFALGFGTEWFILAGAPKGTVEDDLLAGL